MKVRTPIAVARDRHAGRSAPMMPPSIGATRRSSDVRRTPGQTQAVYYRDPAGDEPVNSFLDALAATNPRAAAKVDDYVEEYLNDNDASAPPPEHPISSQVDGELRELRVRFAKTRYRLLYRRSGLLVVLLHIFEKGTDRLPPRDREVAIERFDDFRSRMDADPRRPPRAAGHDAPPKTRGS